MHIKCYGWICEISQSASKNQVLLRGRISREALPCRGPVWLWAMHHHSNLWVAARAIGFSTAGIIRKKKLKLRLPHANVSDLGRPAVERCLSKTARLQPASLHRLLVWLPLKPGRAKWNKTDVSGSRTLFFYIFVHVFTQTLMNRKLL